MTRRQLLFESLTAPAVAGQNKLLEGFEDPPQRFTAWGYTKLIYKILGGPPVLFLHEIPGLVPEAFEFARRLHAAKMSVHMPLFFGAPGQYSKIRTDLQTPCWGSEFDCHARHSTGAIVNWIAEYCLEIVRQHQERKLAVVGNCLTGAIPLALMAHNEVRRHLKCVVISQPALPFGPTGMPKKKEDQRAFGLTEAQLKLAARSNVPVLALKFTDDPFVPEERIRALGDLLRGRPFEYIPVQRDSHCELHPGSKRPKHDHAVLTLGYCENPDSHSNQAYKSVEQFLQKHLGVNG